MIDWSLAASRVARVGCALGLLAPASVAAQTAALPEKAKPAAATKTWTPPRTPFGQPDLQGIWMNNNAAPLERPPALAGKPFLSDEEVAELKQRAARIFKEGRSAFAAGDNLFLAALANPERYENANSTASSVWMVEKEFDNRTSLVVDPADGRIPPLTPAGRQRQTSDTDRARQPAAPDDVSNAYRCITYGVPRLGGRFGDVDFSYFQIMQTPSYIVLRMEAVHEVRLIPLDGRPHLPPGMRQWTGDSRGRWEGDTLVVDTTNFSPKSNFMGSGEHLRLVERFTRVAPDRVDYEATISDPTTWTKPWTAAIRLKQTHDELFEFACHEGNYAMHGMLAGARAEEKSAQAEASGRR